MALFGILHHLSYILHYWSFKVYMHVYSAEVLGNNRYETHFEVRCIDLTTTSEIIHM